MNLIEYPDREMAAVDIAQALAGDLESWLATRGKATLVVPGGSTPGPVFDVLCASDLDWDRVHVFPSDERCVPPASPRSNARMIRERLMTGRAAAARFTPLFRMETTPSGAPADAGGEDGDWFSEDALRETESILVPSLPISVLLLGMGEDMHVASMFPGAPGLEAALDPGARALAMLRPESQPEARITLTARVLDEAINKHLVVFGDQKREALERARQLKPQEAPVAAVLSDMTVHWAE